MNEKYIEQQISSQQPDYKEYFYTQQEKYISSIDRVQACVDVCEKNIQQEDGEKSIDGDAQEGIRIFLLRFLYKSLVTSESTDSLLLQCLLENDALQERNTHDVDMHNTHQKTSQLLQTVRNNTFSLQDVYPSFVAYIDAMQDIQNTTRELAQNIKKHYVQAVLEAMNNGNLPSDVAKGLPRLDEITIHVFDNALEGGDSDGDINNFGNLGVAMHLLKDPDALKQKLYHEFTHILAGKSISLEKDQYGHITGAYNRKDGVRLYAPEGSTKPFVWLNEAITEWLAQELIGGAIEKNDPNSYRGSRSYVAERKVLDMFFDRGLSRQVVLEAYFENFDHTQTEKPHAFARLVHAINTLENQHAFTYYENRFVLEQITRHLRSMGMTDRHIIGKKKLDVFDAKNYEYYCITLHMGTRADTTVQKTMYDAIADIYHGDVQLESVNDERDKIQSVVEAVRQRYGGKVHVRLEKMFSH